MRAIAIVIGCALVGPVSAQGAWPQEPRAVFGVALGEPLAASNLPACPPKPPYEAYPPGLAPIKPCTLPSPHFPGELELHGTPDLGFEYHAGIVQYDGVVFSLVMRLSQTDFAAAMDVLGQRYGKPPAGVTTAAINAYGATLPSQTWQWRGTHTTITATERSMGMTSSSIYFSDLLTASKYKAASDAKNGAAASKL